MPRSQAPVIIAAALLAAVSVAAAAAVVAQRRKKKTLHGSRPLPPSSPSSARLNRKLVTEGEVSNVLAGPLVESIEAHMHMSDGKPIIVGIAGGSGSGKTTLARAVYESLGKDNVTYLCHDSYYRDLSHLPPKERAASNFDHPDSLETELLVEHLRRLKKGEEVDVPVYDFSCHSRTNQVARAVPRKVVILEGILIFGDETLRGEMDIKIFVDTENDVRFIRRLQRDITERGRDPESVIQQYLCTVKPCHEQFVEPCKRYCDIIVPVGLNSVVLDMVVSHLRGALAK